MIHSVVGQIKSIQLYKISYFPEPYYRSKNKINVELNFSNYATKPDLKKAKYVADTSDFAETNDLAGGTSDV